MHLFNRCLCIKTSKTMFARAQQCLRRREMRLNSVPSSYILCLICPRLKMLCPNSVTVRCPRLYVARVFHIIYRKIWWYSIRLNRHAQHWSNVSFIAEHSEMIKIFKFTKNHKEIQYNGSNLKFMVALVYAIS